MVPVGEPPRKNVRWEIADGYLRFWFEVVDLHQTLIDSGRGAAAIAMAAPNWHRVVRATFDHQAREHASRLVTRGALPEVTRIDQWWRDAGGPAQLDVVGVDRTRWRLAGEATWSRSFDLESLRRLERNVRAAGHDPDELQLVSWSIEGPGRDVARVRSSLLHFTAADLTA